MQFSIDAGTIRLSGPLRTEADAASFTEQVAGLTTTTPIVIDVSKVTTLSESGYQALHHAAAAYPGPVTVVCSDVMLLCELELTDLSDVAQLQAHAWLTISQPQQAA